MNTRACLISSIVNNPKAHQVNREAKTEQTINVMCSNMQKKENERMNFKREAVTTEQDRGYGLGRKMGD